MGRVGKEIVSPPLPPLLIAIHFFSGGPLILKGSDADSDVQVGVTSFGAGCKSSFPGVYADIHHVSEWLKDEVCKITSIPSDTFGCRLADVDIATIQNANESTDEEEEQPEGIGALDTNADSQTEEPLCEDDGKCGWISEKRFPEFWCVFHRSSCSRTCGHCNDYYDKGRSTKQHH